MSSLRMTSEPSYDWIFDRLSYKVMLEPEGRVSHNFAVYIRAFENLSSH